MSESSEHHDLVMLMAREVQSRHSKVLIETDVQLRPGESVPRIINGHRPDIYAHDRDEKICLIGEAKAGSDLKRKHTHSQIISFVSYLETRHEGTLILGICGDGADMAKTLLRFLRKEFNLKKTTLQVFDGYDFWTLDRKEGSLWHLSSENLPS